jgi:hypothetical protein
MTYLEPTEHRLEEEDNLAVPFNRMTVACRVATSSSAFSRPHTSTSRETLTKVLQARIKLIQELPHRAQEFPRFEMEEDDVEDRGDVKEGLGESGESDKVEILRERVDGLLCASARLARRRRATRNLTACKPLTTSFCVNQFLSKSPKISRTPS